MPRLYNIFYGNPKESPNYEKLKNNKLLSMFTVIVMDHNLWCINWTLIVLNLPIQEGSKAQENQNKQSVPVNGLYVS